MPLLLLPWLLLLHFSLLCCCCQLLLPAGTLEALGTPAVTAAAMRVLDTAAPAVPACLVLLLPPLPGSKTGEALPDAGRDAAVLDVRPAAVDPVAPEPAILLVELLLGGFSEAARLLRAAAQVTHQHSTCMGTGMV